MFIILYWMSALRLVDDSQNHGEPKFPVVCSLDILPIVKKYQPYLSFLTRFRVNSLAYYTDCYQMFLSQTICIKVMYNNMNELIAHGPF